SVSGTVRDETGGVLPGISVALTGRGENPIVSVTDSRGEHRFDRIPAGRDELSLALVNFRPFRRDVTRMATAPRVDVVLHLALSADVTVTGKRTFTNLADAENPAETLVGVAQSASQGAIIAKQLGTRPIERPGEVLETVPGVVISQHSGEGK